MSVIDTEESELTVAGSTGCSVNVGDPLLLVADEEWTVDIECAAVAVSENLESWLFLFVVLTLHFVDGP